MKDRGLISKKERGFSAKSPATYDRSDPWFIIRGYIYIYTYTSVFKIIKVPRHLGAPNLLPF